MVENFESEVCESNNIAGVQLQESREKNSAAFGSESSFKNQVGVEADDFEKDEQVVEGKKSHSSIETGVLECFSAASKKNGNSYDEISVKSSNVQLKLGKSSQHKDLNNFQSTNSEPLSFSGLFTLFLIIFVL